MSEASLCKQTVKELRAHCRKHGIKGCSGKRKVDLCRHIAHYQAQPTAVTKKTFGQRKCTGRGAGSWTKKHLIDFCRLGKIAYKSKDTKAVLCRKIAAHFRGESQVGALESFSTLEQFRSKPCGVPRKGWLVRELVAVAHGLGIEKYSGKKKKELCKLIEAHFTHQASRVKKGKQARHRTRVVASKRRGSRTFVETLPPDIVRFTGQMLSVRGILAMCDSNSLMARHLCSEAFWRNYYRETLAKFQASNTIEDWDFVLLVAMKVHHDWVAQYQDNRQVDTMIAIEDETTGHTIVVPLTKPRPSRRRRLFHSLTDALEEALPDGMDVFTIYDIPSEMNNSLRRNRAFYTKLREIATHL